LLFPLLGRSSTAAAATAAAAAVQPCAFFYFGSYLFMTERGGFLAFTGWGGRRNDETYSYA